MMTNPPGDLFEHRSTMLEALAVALIVLLLRSPPDGFRTSTSGLKITTAVVHRLKTVIKRVESC